MATSTLIPSGDFRTSYAADTTIFPTATSRNFAIAGIALACFAPMLLSNYLLSIAIQIGIFAIAALGLNVLVGFTGQISIGHAAFFLFGAFTSAYISNNAPIPVVFAIPLAGVITTLVGLVFGVPAARLKGLYLVIASSPRSISCSTSSRAPTRLIQADTTLGANVTTYENITYQFVTVQWGGIDYMGYSMIINRVKTLTTH